MEWQYKAQCLKEASDGPCVSYYSLSEAAAELLTRPAATSHTHLHAHAAAQVGGRAEPDERQPLCGAPMCERGAPIGAVHGQGDAEEDEHRQRVHAVLQLQKDGGWERGRGVVEAQLSRERRTCQAAKQPAAPSAA